MIHLRDGWFDLKLFTEEFTEIEKMNEKNTSRTKTAEEVANHCNALLSARVYQRTSMLFDREFASLQEYSENELSQQRTPESQP